MIASDKRVSLFGNNVDRHDASFSSYLNHDNSSAMVLKLTHPSHISSKKKVEDGEIGIFGAEKYFKGAMDEQVSRTPHSMIKHANFHHPKDLQEKDKDKDKDEEQAKPKTGSVTPSVHSEASWNSRSGLLANNGNSNGNSNRTSHSSRREKTSAVKSLLISLGCNCNDDKSVKIAENKVLVKEPSKPPVKTVLPGGFNDESSKEDCFSFPVMNTRPMVKTEVPKDDESEIIHVKTRRNSEAFGSPVLEKGKKSFSLERKLTMLNWDGVTPRAENIDINIGENNDAGSDASSDLFEIESFSTDGNNSFLARQVSNGRSSNATLPNGYAPSEASIAWSVVTASVAGFSIISDYEDTKMSKNQYMTMTRNGKGGGGDMERMIKGSGILSGCNSHKSVRVSGEHMMVSGGEKDRCRLDSIVPIMKFQTETKPMSPFPRGHSQSPRASHHLYIQQQ